LLKTDREDAPFVAFADPENIHVGQWVIAVGNPFGLGGTVTRGSCRRLDATSMSMPMTISFRLTRR
jgi:S1-C subfamily serine protease